MITVSAYRARTNFGEILNLVYYRGDEVVVERKGKPVVKIVKFADEKPGADLLLESAGLWKDLDTDKMIKNIYRARKDKSSGKNYLASW